MATKNLLCKIQLSKKCRRIKIPYYQYSTIATDVDTPKRPQTPTQSNGSTGGFKSRAAESRQRAIHLSQYYNDPAIDQLAEQPLVKLNAITMMYSSRTDDQAQLLRSSAYLRRELPIRLAHLIKVLRNLPFIIACNQSILEVIERYIQAFRNFESLQQDITDQTSEEKFTEMVREALKLNKDILALLADGFRETRRYIKNEEFIKKYLDQILSARLATRLLCEHHLALHKQSQHMNATAAQQQQQQQPSQSQSNTPSSSGSSASNEQPLQSTMSSMREDRETNHTSPNWVGIINKEFSPRKLVEKSSKMVSNLCMSKYGACPKLKIDGHINAKFPYIPMPIEYILPELLKNSYRATVEHNRNLNSPQMPDVCVTIAVNEKDCVIRIRDRGGGIPHAIVDKIFEYHFTTSSSVNQQKNKNVIDDDDENGANIGIGFLGTTSQHWLSAMHGYGFGLPTSKAYAEYLGGSISFQSLQGIGTDFYLRLALFDAEPYIVKI